jgi:hypothetical protein
MDRSHRWMPGLDVGAGLAVMGDRSWHAISAATAGTGIHPTGLGFEQSAPAPSPQEVSDQVGSDNACSAPDASPSGMSGRCVAGLD